MAMKPLHIIKGKVQQGKKRGKLLGYPTANVALDREIPHGIYVSLIEVDKKVYQSVTFIGNAKTFAEKEVLAETFILNFDSMIYDQWVNISLLRKLRDNQKFSSAEELITQIKKDIQDTEDFFAKTSLSS